MLSIRKVRTASGPVAVQVVQYLGHKSVILKHIGSGKNGEEVFSLVKNANEWIDIRTGRASLFVEPHQKILVVDRGECVGVTHQFEREFLLCCLKGIQGKDRTQ
jgi:hypothetical protein